MVTIPTIEELYSDIKSAFEAEFGVTINPVGAAVLTAFCGVLSGVLKLIYLAIGLTQKNIWVDTCDYDTLVRFGRIILGRYPYPATAGEYTMSVSGTMGAVIDAGTTFMANDTSNSPGALYMLTNSYTMTGTDDVITVVGTTAGANTTLLTGNTLTATRPLINVNQVGTIVTELTAPVDAEDMEAYRSKVIEKIQLVPGSWNAVDYRLVGLNVTGVYQTYAYGADATTVDVYLQGTVPEDEISPTIITNYETALNLVRPLPAFDINVYASPKVPVNITISTTGFTPFTSAQQAVITAALTTFVNSVHPFIAAADKVADRNDVIATYNINATIAAAVPGYGFSGVTFAVDGGAETYWQADNGICPYLNTVTFA